MGAGRGVRRLCNLLTFFVNVPLQSVLFWVSGSDEGSHHINRKVVLMSGKTSITVYDTGEEMGDRWFAVYGINGDALAVGDTGNIPNGFCQSVPRDQYQDEWLDQFPEVDLDSVPEPARKAILAYRDDWFV